MQGLKENGEILRLGKAGDWGVRWVVVENNPRTNSQFQLWWMRKAYWTLADGREGGIIRLSVCTAPYDKA